MTEHHHTSFTRAFLRMAGDAIARRHDGSSLCVVNYHRILESPDPLLESEPDVATFRWQMALLADCFNVVPLRQALADLDCGRLAPRTVCITFDDGYRSVHELALPVLEEFGLPATVFVTSGHVGQGNMWNDRIIDAVQALPSGDLDLAGLGLGLGRYPLNSIDDRRRAATGLTEASKYLPPKSRAALVDRLATLAGHGLSRDLMLTPDMVVDLDRRGVEIGAHTVTHPILTSLDDAGARAEIRAGKEQLEAMIGKPVRLFAYPNGKEGKDFDARHVAMVREAGFEAAFTTAVGAITRGQDRFQLPRSRPWDHTPFLFGLRLLRWFAAGSQHAAALSSSVPVRLAGQDNAGTR
jgi:peptidoglycan/xylan/chitin deacetylase (PgdA/CDA1 family)